MSSLADRVNSYIWFHSIDLGNGIITPGNKSIADHKREIELFFGPIDLTGKSLIDIGAWNGVYSFEAKKRGATVLAVDSDTWTRELYRGRETFELANEALGAGIKTRLIDIEQPLPPDIGAFDVVLFAGVFYHLKNPIAGLDNAASLAKELLIVETHLEFPTDPRPQMIHYPGKELSDDPTNWWGPNCSCMLALLKDRGFLQIDVSINPVHRGRGIFHAWRSTENRRRGPLSECEFPS